MSKGTSRTVKSQLFAAIKRFKFEELEADVLPLFPETTWNQIRSNLMRHHEKFTVRKALLVIDKVINDAKLLDADLRDRLSTLKLLDISRHHNRRIWHTHELRGAKSMAEFISDREIQGKICRAFDWNEHRVDVGITTRDSITFVSVKETRKTRTKRTLEMTPVFFAFFQGHKYLFCLNRNVANEYLVALAQSLGYKSSKPVKLSGRNLKSLMRMLQGKQQGTASQEIAQEHPVFNESAPVIRRTGIDFRQHKQRRSYMEDCLGEDPPVLELLVVEAPDQHLELDRKMRCKNLDIRCEFAGHNMPKMLQSLVERRIIQMPLPAYAVNYTTLGKNRVTLRYEMDT